MTTRNERKVLGETTRTLWNLFSKQASQTEVLHFEKLRKILNDIGLFPTSSQICELVHAACESAGRTPVDHLTFGEFCFLITELQELYRRAPVMPQPRSLLKEKALLALEERRRKRRLSGNAGKFRGVSTDWEVMFAEVFLGGSCNPTTWRHDIAIPFLKKHSITFYNPQVSNWRPELIEIEDQAKQSADLLFFVIDNQTRSTASMVEAAYLAGCGRELVLVIKRFEGRVSIMGEELSDIELEDLQRSHAYLTDLVERQGIPVFSNVDTALHCTNKSVHQNVKVTELTVEDGAHPVKFPHVRIGDKFITNKIVFNSHDSNRTGKLCHHDLNLAFRTITDENLPSSVLSGTRDETYSFEDFCCILAEYRYTRKSLTQRLFCSLGRLHTRIIDWFRGFSPSPEFATDSSVVGRDVFLGGTCGKSTWRQDIAIPILRKHGISFCDPKMEDWSTRYIPREASLKESCKLLLYVITCDTRGITSMLEAGHYVGRGCNIVLCLQPLRDGAQIEDERLTSTAVKDYNRARTYLADLANRDGIPVFEDITEAVNCAVKRLALTA